MSKELTDLVQNLGQPRVLVVGDAMMDRYIWGDAERISQEAPVILLRADTREERLGGASSVATLLRALGARVSLAGVVGGDHDGFRLRQMLLDLGAEAFRRAVAEAGVADDQVAFEIFPAGHLNIEYRYPLSLRYLAERLQP